MRKHKYSYASEVFLSRSKIKPKVERLYNGQTSTTVKGSFQPQRNINWQNLRSTNGIKNSENGKHVNQYKRDFPKTYAQCLQRWLSSGECMPLFLWIKLSSQSRQQMSHNCYHKGPSSLYRPPQAPAAICTHPHTDTQVDT